MSLQPPQQSGYQARVSIPSRVTLAQTHDSFNPHRTAQPPCPAPNAYLALNPGPQLETRGAVPSRIVESDARMLGSADGDLSSATVRRVNVCRGERMAVGYHDNGTSTRLHLLTCYKESRGYTAGREIFRWLASWDGVLCLGVNVWSSRGDGARCRVEVELFGILVGNFCIWRGAVCWSH
jgi:hypothetical protein